ncbi:MAG: hypothetical protein M3Y06_02025, partial [Actinomycetota bacterium]|nr:hypothetical protein [Actinomycetota bacterium]
MSQLTSLGAAVAPGAPSLSFTSVGPALPVNQLPTQTTTAQQSGTVNAALGGSTPATIGVQNALYNYQGFFADTQDVYVSSAPKPAVSTALGSSVAYNSTTPYDTYSASTSLLTVVSSLVGTLKTPYNTTPTDTFSAGIPLLTAVTALSGTYQSFNSQTPVDTYSSASPLAVTTTSLVGYSAYLPATQSGDTYSAATTPNADVSSLSTTSSPYNAVVNLSGTAVSTATQSALTNGQAPSSSGTTSCTLTSPNVSSSASATYTFGATTNLPSWYTAGAGTQVPGGNAPTAITQAGSVSLAANQAIKITFTTPQTVQGGKATIYVGMGSQPSTTAYTFSVSATQASTTQTFTLYGAAAAQSAFIGVTRDAGNTLPTVNITYQLSVPSCGSGGFVSGGSGAAGTCISCGAGYTYDAAAQCCSKTTTTTTCPNGYSLVSGTCYIIQCPTNWTLNASTNVCTSPRCAAGLTEVSGQCYNQTCATGYTLAGSGTACNPNASCTSPLVASGGVCKSQIGCPANGTGGTSWTFNSSTNVCSPVQTCPGKTQWDKVAGTVAGSNSKCWSVAACPTNYTRNTGATPQYCTQNQCASGAIVFAGSGLASAGCYTSTNSCAGLGTGATYTYAASPTYSCTPTNATNGCVLPKVKWDKTNGNNTGTSSQCWTDAGCTAPSTRGTGASTPMCTAALCNT